MKRVLIVGAGLPKNLAKIIAITFVIINNAFGQTTVFFDDFGGTTSGLPTTVNGSFFTTGSTYSPSGSYTFYNGGSTNNQVSIWSGSLAIGTTGSNINVSEGVTFPLSNFASPFSSTLSSNSGLVTWTFNMRKSQATGNPYYSSSSGRYIATVLCASNSDLTSSACVGYMVAQESDKTYALYKFSKGVTSTTAGDYSLIGTATSATANNTDYSSFKVTYDPTNNNWALYFRNDGVSGFSDPASGTFTQAGTSVTDNTYTATNMSVFGFFQRKTTSTSTQMLFDNFKCTVTPAVNPTINLSTNSPSVAPASIGVGSSKNVIYKLTVDAINNSAQLNALKFTTNGSYVNADLSRFQLWFKSGTDDISSASQIGSDLTGTLGPATYSFNGLTQTVTQNISGYFYITADISNSATQNNVISVAATTISDVTFLSYNSINSTTYIGGNQTITVPNIALSSSNPAVSPNTVSQGSSKSLIYKFRLDISSANAQLNTVDFNTSGHVASDISKYQLWYLAGTTDNFASATQIGSDIITGLGPSIHSFSLLTQSIISGSAGYFYITADVAGNAQTGNKITVAGITTANLSFAAANKSGSASAGGDQTIAFASVASDYFKSKATGDWSSASTWQSSHDNSSWNNATAAPTSSANAVTIQSPHVVTISSATSISTATVNTGGELSIASAGTISNISSTLTVNGILSNYSNSTTAIGSSNAKLLFGANSYYKLLSTTDGLIPAADWSNNSTISITALTNPPQDGLTVGLYGATGFGNFIFDCPALTRSGFFKLFGNDFASTLSNTVKIAGNLTLGRHNTTPYIQLTSGNMTINISGNVYQYAGYHILSSYDGTENMNVTGNFIIDATYSYGSSIGYTQPKFSIATYKTADVGTGNLNLTGNFQMISGLNAGTGSNQFAGLEQGNGSIANMVFVGTSLQTATFDEANTVGIITYETKNANTNVSLLSNLTVPGRIKLTNGIFNINNNTVTFHTNDTLLSRTNGTLTVGTGSSLVFGKTGYSTGNAFVIPNNVFSSAPVLSNLTVCRSNLLTLGNQGMQLTGALTLTTGTLNIGAGALLDLNGASLSAPAGYLSGTTTSDLTIRGTTGGTIMLPLTAALVIRTFTIIGTRTVQMDGTKNIGINTAGSFVLGSTAIYDNGGQSQFTKSGTPNTPTFNISGRFITRASGGFFGANSSISTGYNTTDISLNTGSTVEYGLAGDQSVQGSTVPTYYNITFSGSGTKTPLSAVDVNTNGLVTITGTATADFSSKNLASTTANNTAFAMDGGRLKLGTSQTLPLMDGVYTLTGGVVEYNSSSAQTIRSKSYQNIEVTGANIGNSNGNITLNSGGAFTVKTGGTFIINADAIVGPTGSQTVSVENNGTFKCGNLEGFYGAAVGLNSPSVRDNIETLDLQSGSIVEYTRTTASSPATQVMTGLATYKNVIVNGNAPKTLNGPSTINESMTFTSGVVNTTSTNLLTFETGATVQGSPGTSSYINGPAAKKMSAGTVAEFVFPIGKSTGTPIYNPAGIKPVVLGNATQFRAEYFAGPFANRSAMGGSLLGVMNKGYWDIRNSVTTANSARVKLYYNNPGTGNWIYYTTGWSPVWIAATDPCSYCNVAVAHRDSSASSIVWYFTSTNSNFNTSDPEWRYHADQGFIYSHDPMSSHEIFSIAYSYNVILPVQLLSFAGSLQNNNGILDWKIADHQTLAGFELQYSRGGRTFNKLTDVALSNNNSYNYIHRQLPAGANFYRLKLIEKNGEFTYSNIVLLAVGKLPTQIIGLKENPVRSNASVLIVAASNQKTNAVVADALGRVISNVSGLLQAGQNQWNIQTQSLAKGLYFIQVQTEDGEKAIIRFMKE